MEAVESSIPPLTPAQSETLDLIRLPVEERITHSSDLRAQTLLDLEKATIDLVDYLDEPLWVSKHQLQAVNGCEALYEAQKMEPFEWRLPMTPVSYTHLKLPTKA